MIKKHLNLIFVSFASIFLLSFFIYTDVAAMEEIIIDGVYIDEVNIGGMTPDEAEQAVKDYVQDLKGKIVTVEIEEDKIEQITLDELGFTYEDNDYIEEATRIGETGNLLKRYKERKDISHDNLVYQGEYTLDSNKVNEFLETKLSSYDIPAKNASVRREGGGFVYTDAVEGRQVQKEETAILITESLGDNWDKGDINLNAVVIVDQPKYTREAVEKVDTVLGTYTTNYSSSSGNRNINLDNGANLINNTVVYPGEEFDANVELSPFTTSNGWSTGGAYVDGKVVDSIGGGACQVTTTLYNTALYAEMEITERAAHSMTVGYVPLARDAAIAGTYKNLRFRNSTEYPILVQGYTSNRNITFTIWGHETRPANRSVEYETVVLSQTNPPADVETEDPNQPPSYRRQTQSAHTGYVAELYKVVYEDGKQVSRERVNKSSYRATPKYVTVGTMVAPTPEPLDIVTDEPSTEPTVAPTTTTETPETTVESTTTTDQVETTVESTTESDSTDSPPAP